MFTLSALHILIIPEKRDGTIADTRRGGRICIWDSSQRGKSRHAILRAASQFIIPIPKAFLVLKRKMLKSDGESKLETIEKGEKCHKKA